ncbi:MAG TPA: BREX system ATP-binding domain-containing protein [Candidatus Limnocylindrales bacterium]|nr:BREX system ATP-binding domain-containing protein [Candidatus Limnocylindrales bacterium]
MSQVGSLLSPVIVGRDDLVDLALRRLDEVSDGGGRFLLASGEAGIGKTRLLGAIGSLAAGRGFRVAKAELAPQDRDVLAASFLDLGRAMRRDPAFGTSGRELLDVLASRLSVSSPRRRDLVMEVVDLLATDIPTVLMFEDLQWADDLSLETLSELTRQTRDRPLLLVGAYRSNEALHGSVLREWRSRLVTQRLAEEVRLGRLTRDETALMTTLILGTGLPAPRDVVDAVYARTDGVPLHIEELCSALGRERLADSRAVLDAAVPETLEDATLARIGRLSAEAQAVARAGAVVGRSFVPSVLAGMMNLPVEALDQPIQELVDHDVLDPAHGTGQYDFRHQLLRDALYRAVPAGERRRFHARAAEFGATLEGASDIHASVHYERAGMTGEAFRTALAAAREATAMSSHREAFDLFRRAVANMPASLPDAEKVRILLLCSVAASNVDRNVEAADLATRARQLAIRIGDPLGAAEGLLVVLNVARREGDSLTSRRDMARTALNEVEAAAPSPQREELRGSGLYMLGLVEYDACHVPEARGLFLEARELAIGSDDLPSARWFDNMLAQLDILDGHVADGLAAIRSIGEETRSQGQEDNGVGCYRDVALLAMRAMDFREAGIGLAEGLRYAESVEQTLCGHFLASSEALVSWAAGDFDEALRQGGQALSDPGSASSRAMAQWAIGYVEASRGHRREAEEHLVPALEFGRRAERLDMILPALWGLAEAALHTADHDGAAAICDEALRLARDAGDTTLIAPFAPTAVRAHQAAGRPDAAVRFLDQFRRAIGPGAEIARPSIAHARGLIHLGEASITAAREALAEAIRSWDERGRRWEGLWARLDLAAADLRANRYAEAMSLVREVRDAATAMGSDPLLARAGQIERVAKGRGAEVELWHPLTVREFEVAQLIAAGKTNAELADELSISPKTASAHVEHILAKLGVSRRTEIAAWTSAIAGTASPTAAGVAPRR